MRFCAAEARVEFDLTFHWNDWGKGVLRLGHFTLLPDAFNSQDLMLETCNGGGAEKFALAGHSDRTGRARCRSWFLPGHGLGLTEGWAVIGDNSTRLKIAVDRATAPLLGF